jgi:HEAT repeat protein
MAAWALGRIGSAAEGEIPFLAETMRTTTLLAVRRSTAEALGNFGAAAEPAVGDLVKMLKNEDEITRCNAAVALWKINRHPKAMPALLELLRPGNTSQAYAAAVALGQLPQAADAAGPALIAAVHAHSADVRRAASRSLGQLGKAAFPALQKANALHDPDPEARRLVIEALTWMGRDALRPLIAALKDESPNVRRAAARALGSPGGELHAEVRDLEKAAGDPEKLKAAKDLLGKIRSALETAASDPDEDVRTAAAKALQAIRGE